MGLEVRRGKDQKREGVRKGEEGRRKEENKGEMEGRREIGEKGRERRNAQGWHWRTGDLWIFDYGMI